MFWNCELRKPDGRRKESPLYIVYTISTIYFAVNPTPVTNQIPTSEIEDELVNETDAVGKLSKFYFCSIWVIDGILTHWVMFHT